MIVVAVTVAVAIEIVIPGQAVYHTGWYNVLIAASVLGALAAARRRVRQTRSTRARIGIVALVTGALISGLAGVASGLLGPDNQSFVGAPGQRVRVESLGLLFFPLASEGTPVDAVTLERPLHAPVAIAQHRRNVGNFILQTTPHSVVYVEARDLNGNRLTITQPTGSAFLSPVLLMAQRQTIAGMDLPYDSFNVPAARRIVKTVMFTAAQSVMLLHGGALLGQPSVLFAVEDENGRPLPHAVALSSGGRPARAGGLILRGSVADYPSVEVVSAPNLAASALGALLVVGGLIALISSRSADPRR
ncbi:MAG: hypothetical protein JO113_06315 [Candidatus Eremiobacteraeota bacterium]|nr:hypothetical protein [Candidatus Eremiobacteraeota bacterium]